MKKDVTAPEHMEQFPILLGWKLEALCPPKLQQLLCIDLSGSEFLTVFTLLLIWIEHRSVSSV